MPHASRLLTWVPWAWPAPVFWSVAACLALTTGGGALSALGRLEHTAASWGSPVPVPIAVRVLDPGDVVGVGDVIISEVPRRLLPRGSPPAAAWIGRTVVWPVVEGEVVLAARLAPRGVEGAAALVPKGARAVAIPAGPGGRPPLRIGDRVDVLATVALDTASPDGSAGPPTFVVAERALVVAVDDRADVVTVAVRATVAPRVAHAVATAAVTLALTGPR